MNKNQFRKECNDVASRLELSDPLFFDDDRAADAFEDDGTIHIIRSGLRACFGVEDDDGAAQNVTTRRLMDALGIPVSERVLVEETEDDDDCCPHCGRCL